MVLTSLIAVSLADPSVLSTTHQPAEFAPILIDDQAEVPVRVLGRPAERHLSLDDEGRVLDSRGRLVKTIEFAERFGDEATIRAYRTERGVSVPLFVTATAVGGAAFLGGALFGVGGSIISLAYGGSPFENPAFLHAGLFTIAGGALASGGIYGIVVGKRQVDDPRNWYHPETLDTVIEEWNGGNDPRDIVYSIGVSIGPGTVLLQGSF